MGDKTFLMPILGERLEKVRENVACPQLGDDHYGAWGTLPLECRITIARLVETIKHLQKENEPIEDAKRKAWKWGIEEFAERLKRHMDYEEICTGEDEYYYWYVTNDDIDELLKEMTERE